METPNYNEIRAKLRVEEEKGIAKALVDFDETVIADVVDTIQVNRGHIGAIFIITLPPMGDCLLDPEGGVADAHVRSAAINDGEHQRMLPFLRAHLTRMENAVARSMGHPQQSMSLADLPAGMPEMGGFLDVGHYGRRRG